MANFSITSKYYKLKQNGTLHVAFLCLVVSLGLVANGAGNAYLSPAIPNLNENPNAFHVNDDEASWIACISHLGAIPGGAIAAPLADYFGRKPSCIIFCLPFVLGWLLNIVATNVFFMYASRFFIGIAQGMAVGICMVYLVEVAPAKIRGALNSFGNIGYTLGKLYNYSLGTFLDWNWLAVANLALVAVAACSYYFIPETPRWLLSHTNGKCHSWREEKAIKVLKKLRGGEHAEIGCELKEIEESVTKSVKKVSWTAFFDRKHMFNLLICLVVLTVFQLGGAIVITQYTVVIIDAAHTTMDSNLQTIIVGLTDVIGAILCSIMVDIIGRRKLFLISTLSVSVFITSLATYFYVDEVSNPDFARDYLNWLPMLSLVLSELMLNVGIGSMIWLLPGELFSTEARGKAMAVSVVWSHTCQFLAAKYFVNLTDRIGLYGGFWICAAIDLLGFVFFFFFIPETMNKSLEQLQDDIDDEV